MHTDQDEQWTDNEEQQAGDHTSRTNWQTQIDAPRTLTTTRAPRTIGEETPAPDHGSTALTPGGGSRLQGCCPGIEIVVGGDRDRGTLAQPDIPAVGVGR